jgi:hypothetical protein
MSFGIKYQFVKSRGRDDVDSAFAGDFLQYGGVPPATGRLGVHNRAPARVTEKLQLPEALFSVVDALIRVNLRGISPGDGQMLVTLAKSEFLGRDFAENR